MTDKLLQELSLLSRETSHASFNIQHSKETGYWKVVFANAMVSKTSLKEKEHINDALQEAIDLDKKQSQAN